MSQHPPISRFYAATHALCPRCGKGHVFHHLVDVTDTCNECALDLHALDHHDHATFITIAVMGALVTVLAGSVEIAFSPPLWIQAMLWTPFILLGSILSLRFFKAWHIATHYHTHTLS